MNLAKNHIDLGLFSNKRDEQLAFWQNKAGLDYDHMGKLGGGMQQHRHFMNGSILKMNHARVALPALPPSGWRALQIARAGIDAPLHLADPDGNRVSLVPPGSEGIGGIAIRLNVSNRDATEHFYRHAMQFSSPRKGVYQCGDSLLIVDGEEKIARADEYRAPGYRYITVQIWDAAAETEGIIARGGEMGHALTDLGETVRFSFVRDPDGNWIEISQRASLTGGHL